MKRLIPVLALLVFVIACQKAPVEIEKEIEADIQDAFVHTAYFWFKEEATSEQITAFKAASEKLREVETVLGYFAGAPAPTTRPVIENTYDYAIVFLFEDLEAQEFYQQHPLHLAMIEKHQDIWERVMVTDVDRN